MHARRPHTGTTHAARTLAACAAVLLTAGVRGDATAPSAAQAAAVTALHDAWGAADAAHDGEKAAKLMAAGGVAILDGGDEILMRDEIAAFISGADGSSGDDDNDEQQRERDPTEFNTMATIAQNISTTQTILHAGGRNNADGSLFYTRMVPTGTGESWTLETVLVPTMHIEAADEDAGADAPAWVRAALQDMMGLLAKHEYEDAVNTYFADHAVALSVLADAFATTKRDITGTLRQMVPASVFAEPHKFRIVAAQGAEGGRVFHVIAERVNELLGLVHRCYLRWEAVAGGEGSGTSTNARAFKIAVMTPIGAGCEGDPCETAASVLPMHVLEGAAGEIDDILRKAFDVGADIAHDLDDALAAAMRQLENDATAAAARAEVLTTYAAAINSGRYKTAALVHAKGGCVVPYGGGRLLAAGGDELPAYFKTMHEGAGGSGSAGGIADVELAQHRMTARFDGGAFHTVGVNGADGSVYYIRWARKANAVASGATLEVERPDIWEIATMAWSIGGGSATGGAGTEAHGSAGQPPAWLPGRLAEIARLYNTRAYEKLTALFTPDAVLVPMDVSRRHLELMGQGEVAGYIESVHDALAGDVEFSLVDAMSEKVPHGTQAGKETEVWHVLGRATVKASKYTGEFYMRWVEEGGQWRVQTEVMRVGAPPPLPQQQQHPKKKDNVPDVGYWSY